MSPPTAERLLRALLRTMGATTLLAFGAVLLPTSWMEAGARWTGVAPFPDGPLAQYLARSLSALYAMIGALTLFVASDLQRYLPLVAFCGWLTIALGIVLFFIDMTAGMPPAWGWFEGPPTVLLGVTFHALARRASAPTAACPTMPAR